MKYTVLVVEDEPAIHDLLSSVLEDVGYSVLLAENGQKVPALAVQASGTSLVLLKDITAGDEWT